MFLLRDLIGPPPTLLPRDSRAFVAGNLIKPLSCGPTLPDLSFGDLLISLEYPDVVSKPASADAAAASSCKLLFYLLLKCFAFFYYNLIKEFFMRNSFLQQSEINKKKGEWEKGKEMFVIIFVFTNLVFALNTCRNR